jgi:shikimate dehydrogenase
MEATGYEITGQTRIMFILADPVAHIRGSAILTRQLNELGCNVAVAPLHVKPADLGTVISTLRLLHNVPGFGITIPHKIPVRQYLDAETPRAAKVGSVNFVKRDADGRLTGDNVDGVGFIDGLVRSGIDTKGMRVLQLGAGGAGRSIAFSLAESGAASLAIGNRDTAKGAALATAVRAAYPACDVQAVAPAAGGFDPRGFDLIVNTTSVGMKADDPMLIDASGLAPEMAVAEIIMTPELTPILQAALARGCRISLGKHMLEEQVRRVQRFFEL